MKKLTRGQSCVLCQQRKIRCDKQKPCSNCVRAQRECKVLPMVPPKPRRSKQTLNRELVDRLLAEHGVDVRASEASGPKARSSSPSSARSTTGTPGVKWFAYNKEYEATDELLRDSDNEGHSSSDQPAIYDDFDARFDDPGGFPFVVTSRGSCPKSLVSLHPPIIDILQLWQVYIQRVDPLLKIGHVPTLQAQIIQAAGTSKGTSGDDSHASGTPKPLEALMFSIYLVAVHAMTDSEAQDTLHEPKHRMLARYHHATQQALINAAFMRAPELMVLHAYLLYLFSLSRTVDPRSLSCLTGIAMRIATRTGLQRDSARFGMSPFETEMRRRIWWQTVILDKRLAEMTGSPGTALVSSASGDCCRRPLNVNDLSLHPAAKEAPTAVPGHSEMLFSRTRMELAIAMTEVSLGILGGSGSPPQGTPATDDTASAHAGQADSRSRQGDRTPLRRHPDLDAYCAYFEDTYLQHCDPAIPVQNFTLLMSREALCNLKIYSFMRRRVPSSTLPLHERDALVMAAVQMVESDTVVCTTDSLRGFRWYADLYVPMLGLVFLANELRLRPHADLSDRAWKALSENRENRRGSADATGGEKAAPGGGRQPPTSPIQAAFDRMLLKAWAAYEEADKRRAGRSATKRPPPQVIVQIKAERGESVPEPSPAASGGESGREASPSDDLPVPGPDPTLAAHMVPTPLSGLGRDDHGFEGAIADDFGEFDEFDWMFFGQSDSMEGFTDGSGLMF